MVVSSVGRLDPDAGRAGDAEPPSSGKREVDAAVPDIGAAVADRDDDRGSGVGPGDAEV
jgi:hypothetical protein